MEREERPTSPPVDGPGAGDDSPTGDSSQDVPGQEAEPEEDDDGEMRDVR